MEEPPIIQAESVAAGKVGLGRIGLFFALASVAALATMWLAKPG